MPSTEPFEKNLKKYDKPFMAERNQPDSQQERTGLNELFD